MTLLFDIGFLSVRFWDIVDILVVGYLIYQVYRLLRGSVAFNIFVGVVLLYVVWWLVRALKMDLLSLILGQFVSVGVVVIAIVFQPELRRFLLLLGNQTLRGRLRFLKLSNNQTSKRTKEEIEELKETLLELSEKRVGALIVLSNGDTLAQYAETGVILDAKVNRPLLISLFNPEAPMHDGAVIIHDGRVHAASCILPVTENQNLPEEAGLRHRAAVGITEVANVAAFVVSEESGRISVALQGKLLFDLDDEMLNLALEENFL